MQRRCIEAGLELELAFGTQVGRSRGTRDLGGRHLATEVRGGQLRELLSVARLVARLTDGKPQLQLVDETGQVREPVGN